MRKVLAGFGSAALLVGLSGIPAEAATDVAVNTTLGNQTVADDSSSIPGNPTQSLPSTVSSSIPDSATVVAKNLAVTTTGQVKNLQTGANVTDPRLVGTVNKPADPLAKTDGRSFIPVSVATVKKAVSESQGGSVTNSSETSAHTTVRSASFSGNEYGAYWGTYSGTPAFFESDGTLFAQQAKGVIDVSQWQGSIDWAKAKADGVQGAIIRVSFGWGNGFDPYALRNISECKRLGIPFGVYSYSYSYDSATAALEGADLASLLKQAGVSPSDLSYPVFYDLENWTWTGHTRPSSPSVYDGIVNSWYSKLQAAGYTNLSVYSYSSYLSTALNSSNIHSKTRWVASYGSRTGFSYPTNDRGWQYTSDGSINGISGSVDLNAFGNKTFVGDSSGGSTNDVRRFSAISIPDGKYYINSYAKDSSGVDITDGSLSDGAITQLYGCNGSQAQQFQFTKQSDGSYVITNVGSGKALDVASGQAYDNATVRQWSPNGSATQRWVIRDSGAGYYIQSALGNWVLDVRSGITSDGTVISLYEPNSTKTQKYLLSSVSASIPLNVKTAITSTINGSLAMDIPQALSGNGGRVQLNTWNAVTSQLYRFARVGNGIFQITDLAAGRVVEVAGGSTQNGGVVQQYASNGTAAQHWSVIDYGNGGFSLVNNASGKAIDTPGAHAAQGQTLQIYSSNGSAAQKWSITQYKTSREQLDDLASDHKGDVKDGTYALNSLVGSPMTLDVAGGSLSNGASVRLWSSNGTGAQRWKVSHDAQGYVTLTNVQSGKVLDVPGGSAQAGNNVQQYDANGSWAQKWIAVKGPDGSLTLYSALAKNLVLDVAGGLKANGTNVQIYYPNGTNAQKWKTV